jgi:RimJ/RimL family protein N-acetyltransferase
LQTIKSVINRRDIVVIPGEMFTTLDKYREIEKMFKLKAKYFDKKDISTKVLWMNDKRINHQMFFDLPATVENTQKWFEHNIGNKNRVDFSFITNGSYVAMGGFTNIDHIANHAEFYVMVNPEMHGKGIGGKVSYWMYNYAFVKLNLNKIYLYTNKDNVSAYKIYERAGFKLEGVLRQHKYKKGVLLDRRFYGLLREEWELQNWSKKELSYELD